MSIRRRLVDWHQVLSAEKHRTYFRHLARGLILRTGQTLVRELGRRNVGPGACEPVRKQVHAVATERGDAVPFFCVLVPGSLPFAVPAIAMAQRHIRVVAVLNGLSPEETRALLRTFPEIPRIELPRSPLGPRVLPHDVVVRMLVETTPRLAGLIDPDIYVFDETLFHDIESLGPGLCAAISAHENELSQRPFPTTHLMALHTARLRELQTDHSIDAAIYRRTPRQVREQLRRIQISDTNFPKSHVPYYDTLHLSLAVAHYAGLSIRIASPSDDDWFHIGGISYRNNNAYLEYIRQTFISLPICAHLTTMLPPSAETQRACRHALEKTAPADHLERLDERLARIATSAHSTTR